MRLTQTEIKEKYIAEHIRKIQSSIKTKRACKTCKNKFPTPVKVFAPKYFQDGVTPCRFPSQMDKGDYEVYKNTGRHRFCSAKCASEHEKNRKDGFYIKQYVWER